MKKNIIEQLSWKKTNPKKRLINGILTAVGASIMLTTFLTASFQINQIYRQKQPYLTAKCLVETPGAEKAAFNYLKQNPDLVDKFPNHYSLLKDLRRAVIDEKPPKYLNKLEEMVLRNAASNAGRVEITNEDYNRIQAVRELNPKAKEMHLKKIWNTPFGIFFGYQHPVVIGHKDEHPELWEKIQELVKPLGSFKMGRWISSKTRVLYKNDKLYVNAAYSLCISDGKLVSEIRAGFFDNEFVDYLVVNDKNGEERIAISQGSSICVYKPNGSFLYTLRGIPFDFSFSYGRLEQEPEDLFMPDILKTKIKEKLRQ